MDFSPTPGQQDAEGLARRIFSDRCTSARHTEVERERGRFDAALWRALGDAGLLSLALPEEHDGAGLGTLEDVTVLREAGRVVAPVPLAAHLAACRVLADLGTLEQQRVLTAAAEGRTIVTAAVAEDHDPAPARPATTAVRAGDHWVVTGAKTAVPAGTVAEHLLVPVTTDDGDTALVVVHPEDPGVAVHEQRLSGSEVVGRLELSGVTVSADRVVPGGADAVTALLQHLDVSWCAYQLGVCEGALDLTAAYARTREQFGGPIGSFQAVAQRLADAYIDVRGFALTVLQAAWRLDEGLPCAVEIATARLWAADAGHRVAHTTVHVHGGVGIDLDGDAHRYFTAATRIESALGGTTRQARAVGRVLATEPV